MPPTVTKIAEFIDGFGQTGTRIWSSLTAAPAPRLGAFIVVDDGSNGALYVGLSVSGVATWVRWADLLHVVVTNPGLPDNQIVSTDSSVVPLAVSGVATAIVSQSDSRALNAIQNGGGPTVSVIHISRVALTPAVPMVDVDPGTGSVTSINGYGEITIPTYSSLPTPNANHLGVVARALGGTGVQDSVFICVLDSTGTPIWATFQGPAGTPGTNGVTPLLRESGGYIQVSYDGGTTWSNLLPLADITGPAGPAGLLNFPPLPSVGGNAVTFWLQCLAGGQPLPWQLPPAYTFQVVDSWGRWGSTDGTGVNFFSDALGNNNGASAYHDISGRGYNVGRAIAEFFDDTGTPLEPDSTHIFYDPFTVLTAPQLCDVTLTENVSAAPFSSLWLQLTVTPPTYDCTHFVGADLASDWNTAQLDGSGWGATWDGTNMRWHGTALAIAGAAANTYKLIGIQAHGSAGGHWYLWLCQHDSPPFPGTLLAGPVDGGTGATATWTFSEIDLPMDYFICLQRDSGSDEYIDSVEFKFAPGQNSISTPAPSPCDF